MIACSCHGQYLCRDAEAENKTRRERQRCTRPRDDASKQTTTTTMTCNSMPLRRLKSDVGMFRSGRSAAGELETHVFTSLHRKHESRAEHGANSRHTRTRDALCVFSPLSPNPKAEGISPPAGEGGQSANEWCERYEQVERTVKDLRRSSACLCAAVCCQQHRSTADQHEEVMLDVHICPKTRAPAFVASKLERLSEANLVACTKGFTSLTLSRSEC